MSDGPCNLITMTLDFWACDAALRDPTVYQAWPDDLDLWSFDLETALVCFAWGSQPSYQFRWYSLLSVAFVLILLFLGLFVRNLWANTCQTYRVTSRPWPFNLVVMELVGVHTWASRGTYIDWLCIVFIVWFICRSLLTHSLYTSYLLCMSPLT